MFKSLAVISGYRGGRNSSCVALCECGCPIRHLVTALKSSTHSISFSTKTETGNHLQFHFLPDRDSITKLERLHVSGATLCEVSLYYQHAHLLKHKLQRHILSVGLTLSSSGSECSHKQLGTSHSLLSHQKGCTIWVNTHRRSPYRPPGRSACQPTGLFGYSLHFLWIKDRMLL